MTTTNLPQGKCVESGKYAGYTHEVFYFPPSKSFTIWITTKSGVISQIGIASNYERALAMYDAFYLSKNL